MKSWGAQAATALQLFQHCSLGQAAEAAVAHEAADECVVTPRDTMEMENISTNSLPSSLYWTDCIMLPFTSTRTEIFNEQSIL